VVEADVVEEDVRDAEAVSLTVGVRGRVIRASVPGHGLNNGLGPESETPKVVTAYDSKSDCSGK